MEEKKFLFISLENVFSQEHFQYSTPKNGKFSRNSKKETKKRFLLEEFLSFQNKGQDSELFKMPICPQVYQI